MSDLFGIERSVESVEVAVGRVEKAVDRVAAAVKYSRFDYNYVIWGLAGPILVVLMAQIWHSEWRYKLRYSLDDAPLQYMKEPHDCEFLSAPLGEKHCTYEPVVLKVQWAISSTGLPIESIDEGKTWSIFTPGSAVTMPKKPKLERIVVQWQRKEN